MKIFRLVLICGAVMVSAGSALAHMNTDPEVSYRQSLFHVIGWNFSPLGAMNKGKIPFDAKEATLRADRLAALAPQILEGFRKTSAADAKTDAQPLIWKQFDDFTSKANALVEQTKLLADATHSGDEAKFKAQFAKTAEACKNCHEKYKKDDD